MRTNWKQAPWMLAVLLVGACSGDAASGGRLEGTLTLTGQTDHGGIVVAVLGTDRLAATDPEGHFAFDALAPGAVTVEARRSGFQTARFLVTIVDGETTTLNETLSPGGVLEPGLGIVSGTVHLLGRQAHGDVVVTLSGGSASYEFEATSAADGTYVFPEVPAGVYSLSFVAAPFHPVTFENVVTASGTLTVSPVVLRIARPLDHRVVTSADFAPAGGKAVLWMTDAIGTQKFIYDAAGDSFLEIETGKVLAFTDAGDAALVPLGSALQRLDLETGALTGISPASASSSVVAVEEGSVFYMTAQRELAAWSTKTGSASVMAPAVCPGSTWFVWGLPGDWESRGHWSRLRFLPACGPLGGSYSSHFLFDGEPLPGLGFVRQAHVSPDKTIALVVDVDDLASSELEYTLKRVNLETGAVEVVATDLHSGAFQWTASAWSRGWFRHSVDATTGRASYASFDPFSGTATTLVEDAIFGGRVALVGDDQDAYVLRFDLGTATLLCEGPDAVVRNGETVTCSDAQNALFAYDHEAERAVSLAANGVWKSNNYAGVLYEDSDTGAISGWAPGFFEPLVLCQPDNANSWRIMGRSSSQSADSQGRVWAFRCNAEVSLVDFDEGAIRHVRTWTVANEFYNAACSAAVGTSVVCGAVPVPESDTCDELGVCVSTENGPGMASHMFIPWRLNNAFWSDDGSGAIVQTSSSSHRWMVVRFPPGETPVARSLGAVNVGQPVIGPRGLFAVWSSGAAWTLNDLLTGASTALTGTNAPLRLGDTWRYLVGDSVVDLETGAVIPLSSNVSARELTDSGVLTYKDSTTGDLWKYDGGESPVLLAPATRLMSSSAPDWLFSENANGTTSLGRFDSEQATFTVLAENVLPRFNSAGSNRGYLFRDADEAETQANLLVVNLVDGTLVDLDARVSLRGEPITTYADQVLFQGAGDPGQDCLYFARLDGTSTTCLPGPSRTYSFLTEGYALFESDGVMWLSDGEAPPVALEQAGDFRTPFLRPDGKLLLLPVSLPGELPPREGTFRMDLGGL